MGRDIGMAWGGGGRLAGQHDHVVLQTNESEKMLSGGEEGERGREICNEYPRVKGLSRWKQSQEEGGREGMRETRSCSESPPSPSSSRATNTCERNQADGCGLDGWMHE